MPTCCAEMDDFATTLTAVVRAAELHAAVRAALLMTRDRDQAWTFLRQVSGETGRPLYRFSVAGRERFNHEQLRWETVGSSNDPFDLIRAAEGLAGGGIVAFEDMAQFLGDERGDRRVRMAVANMLASESRHEGGLVLVFIEPDEAEGRLPSMLADQIVRLEVPYPRFPELETIARRELGAALHALQSPIVPENIKRDAARLAAQQTGLTRSAARDALRDALAANPHDLQGALERLQSRKAFYLSRELAMEVLGRGADEDPIGLDYLVDYLEVIEKKIRLFGPERARGILLIGPPGTGKTLLAKAIGRITGLEPVVAFRIDALMNSLLGETERRFSQAFATLEAMAPNIVFIDELEKAFGDSSERDGGTMMRVTGRLLSWLSDNPYPNFIVATCNSLTRMGEIGQTMTRSERFDRIFFIDVPCMEARRLMLARWLASRMEDHEAAASELAALTEKFSGADLRSAVKDAANHAEHRGTPLTIDILKQHLERRRMRAIALYDEFQQLRDWGRRHCDPAGPTD